MEEKILVLLRGASTIPVPDTDVPDVFPCVTFHFFNENAALLAGGKATEEGASCQVDIWYKLKTAAVTSTISAIKSALKAEKYFTYPEGDSIYDPVTRVWHKYYTFNFIESEA